MGILAGGKEWRVTCRSRLNCLAVSSRTALEAFLCDDSGQDVVEYGLLTVFFGIVGVVAWTGIRDGIAESYETQDGAIQNLWESPVPSSN
jgi:Flp pilus assembly pilin Flp